jgi:hypothetical protein
VTFTVDFNHGGGFVPGLPSGRPKGGYYLKGKRIPSVTTILGRFKESGGLIHWAWQLGREGKDYREERDSSANAGKLAHSAVEAWIRGQPFSFEAKAGHDVVVRAQTSFGAFLKWANQTHLRATHTEVPLISKEYLYGGTFDAILIDDRRAMGDWKTSNGVYPEYLMQLAAYKALWEENFPNDPITGGYHLLRFDKTYGDFAHHWWGELDTAWEAFKHLRALYDLDKELKARTK